MSRGDALGRLRSALEDHGCRVRGTSAQCPAPDHDDQQASLSIGQGREGAVLNCHAGCATDIVLEALGMSAADLYDTPWEANGQRPVRVAEYVYTDENGRPLFRKVRLAPKAFFIEHRNQRGGWDKGLGGARPVLYQLPRVLAAVAAGDTVYVAEGEKDCDRLAAESVTATTNFEGAAKSGGQSKWRPAYSDTLRGANVVIIADRDDAGHAHAAAVKASVAIKAKSVTVVEAAEGKDASDHLAAGRTLAELVPERQQPSGTGPLDWAHIIDWHEAFGAKPAHVEWLIEPLLERGTLNAWFGKPGAWKSLLALEASAALAAGQGVFGQPASEPVTVLYIDVENSVNHIVERLQAFGYHPGDLKRLVYSSFPDVPALDTIAGGQRLVALTETHSPALVIIDTTSRIIAGKENDADTFLQLYRNTLVPLKQRGITVLRLDHPGKDTERGQRGSSAKDGDVDTVWHVDQVSDTAVNLERRKSRSGHGIGALYLTRGFEPLRHEPGGTFGISPRVAAIIEALERVNAPGDRDDRKIMLSARAAGKLLRDHGERFRNEDLAQAVRLWREHSGSTGSTPPQTGAPRSPHIGGEQGSGPPPEQESGP